MRKLELPGRILYLSDDADKMRAQFAGADLTLSQAVPLRDSVSTDEITPSAALTFFDERIARSLHTGFSSGDAHVVRSDAVLDGGFCVTVAGDRYGKGSSREHSPAAEQYAGMRLIIARSFERIYRQNADNVGLFTSTDFGLLERIERGEAIMIDELLQSRDHLSASILRAGGLLKYGRKFMKQVSLGATTAPVPIRTLSLGEKILLRHAIRTAEVSNTLVPGEGAFVCADWRFIVDPYTSMAAHMMHAEFGRPLKLLDSASIIAFADHFSYIDKSPAHIKAGSIANVRVLHQAHEAFAMEYGLRSHGYQIGREGSEGISHPMMIESYALPGQLIVGTDSHTPHSGALGCLAFGIGTTDMANAMLTGAVRITVPRVIRIEVNGRLPLGVTGKDLVLHLLALPELRSGVGVGAIMEFGGGAVRAMGMDERTTLTNMAAELGGFSGIVEPDAETVRFLKERRGIDFEIEPWMRSDPNADYAHVITVDASSLSPIVSSPGEPGNGVPLSSLAHRERIDIAFAGTCTGGKRADFDMYHEVLTWAADRNMRVADGVTLYLQFGTRNVRDYCVEKGYLDTFEKVGAVVLEPSCGACANLGPGASERATQVTVSAQNRNFPGRSGPGKVWLASPPTVVASAIAGTLMSFEELTTRSTHQEEVQR